MAANITAWSYSRWACYQECPRKAMFKFIDKLPEPGSTAMDRGSAMHALTEELITGKISGKPEDAAKAEAFRDEFKRVVLPNIKKDATVAKKGKPVAECEWAFTTQWTPTSWFGRDAWCRIKTDLVFTAKKELTIVDHKTGKRREEQHQGQLSLYALGGFIMYPAVDRINTAIWYLDAGAPNLTSGYDRDELPDIKNAWLDKTRPMLTDTVYAPRPGNYCRWCHFRKANGGPCEY